MRTDPRPSTSCGRSIVASVQRGPAVRQLDRRDPAARGAFPHRDAGREGGRIASNRPPGRASRRALGCGVGGRLSVSAVRSARRVGAWLSASPSGPRSASPRSRRRGRCRRDRGRAGVVTMADGRRARGRDDDAADGVFRTVASEQDDREHEGDRKSCRHEHPAGQAASHDDPARRGRRPPGLARDRVPLRQDPVRSRRHPSARLQLGARAADGRAKGARARVEHAGSLPRRSSPRRPS